MLLAAFMHLVYTYCISVLHCSIHVFFRGGAGPGMTGPQLTRGQQRREARPTPKEGGQGESKDEEEVKSRG
jgi:hypothetical protein